MTKTRLKHHIPDLNTRLDMYAHARVLDFMQFSPYHMRLADGGYVCVDLWTNGRYYVAMCDYEFLDNAIPTRGGEKGTLPTSNQEDLWPFLDKIFFGADMSGSTDIRE